MNRLHAMRRHLARYCLSLATVIMLSWCLAVSARSDNNTSSGDAVSCERTKLANGGQADETRRMLSSFLSSDDDDVAILAAWNRVLLDARSRDGDLEATRLAAVSIHRFLGVLEGRTRIAVPDSFEATLENAELRDRRVILRERRDRHGALESSTLRPSSQNNVFIVSYGGYQFPVEIEGVTVAGGTWITIAENGIIYGVNIQQMLPGRYPLVAIDPFERRLLWHATVHGRDCGRPTSGSGWFHTVEIVTTPDHVAVFGAATRVAYLNVFDRQTGNPHLRFSTRATDGEDEE